MCIDFEIYLYFKKIYYILQYYTVRNVSSEFFVAIFHVLLCKYYVSMYTSILRFGMVVEINSEYVKSLIFNIFKYD